LPINHSLIRYLISKLNGSGGGGGGGGGGGVFSISANMSQVKSNAAQRTFKATAQGQMATAA